MPRKFCFHFSSILIAAYKIFIPVSSVVTMATSLSGLSSPSVEARSLKLQTVLGERLLRVHCVSVPLHMGRVSVRKQNTYQLRLYLSGQTPLIKGYCMSSMIYLCMHEQMHITDELERPGCSQFIFGRQFFSSKYELKSHIINTCSK